MSLKENMEYVKKEISAQESFMENFFKFELFYKRNKVKLLVVFSIVVAGVIGYYTTSYIQQQNKIEANELFNKYLEDPSDQEVFQLLQEKNKKLASVALFVQDRSAPTKIEFLEELSLYFEAMKQEDLEKLEAVIQDQNFLLKDFALINKALIFLKKEQYEEAKQALAKISKDSELQSIVQMLNHHLMVQ